MRGRWNWPLYATRFRDSITMRRLCRLRLDGTVPHWTVVRATGPVGATHGRASGVRGSTSPLVPRYRLAVETARRADGIAKICHHLNPVELRGLEPLTPALQRRCLSQIELRPPPGLTLAAGLTSAGLGIAPAPAKPSAGARRPCRGSAGSARCKAGWRCWRLERTRRLTPRIGTGARLPSTRHHDDPHDRRQEQHQHPLHDGALLPALGARGPGWT